MNLIQSKTNPARLHSGGFVEKIIRDKEGRLVRATFSVYENGGRIKARLVEYVYLTNGTISGNVLALGGLTSPKVKNQNFSFDKTVKSPYFNKESLYFSGSKPRAPTF